jgi:ABC-type transport system involved in multi-copper enzyme maturation permease subunit
MNGTTATLALARLAVVRALRGRALYVAMALVVLPITIASVRIGLGHEADEVWRASFALTLLVLPIVPSILVGPSLADELEDKTSAYLWSRPLPRWSIVAGKLVGLAPAAAAIMVVGLLVCWLIVGGPGAVPAGTAARGVAGIAGAAIAGSMVVVMIATLVPKHAVATSVVYLLFVDAAIGALPLKFQYTSVAFAGRTVAGFSEASLAGGLVTLLVIGALTVSVAIRRIATLE